MQRNEERFFASLRMTRFDFFRNLSSLSGFVVALANGKPTG
jgi:hypothetical protein